MAEQFRTDDSVPVQVPIFGNLFVLQNDGENLELYKINEDSLGPPILVDRVRYNTRRHGWSRPTDTVPPLNASPRPVTAMIR